jgi:CRP-like cAMP-binding protein
MSAVSGQRLGQQTAPPRRCTLSPCGSVTTWREELELLAAVVTTRQLVRGEIGIRPGDSADKIYVVLSGEIKDSVLDVAGEEVVRFLHGPGTTFGEPGFIAVAHCRGCCRRAFCGDPARSS